MGVNHRRNDNPLKMAIPMLDAHGNVEGWYKFDDEYLSPEVRYTAIPPTTWMKIGGRFLEIDRAVPLKIRLLEEEEDYHFWCKKKQHSQRINCGEYHKDFGDVEVGYSFSSPQTHIWFAGYAIHTDTFENLHISSHNATVRVTPEHVIPKNLDSDKLRHSLTDKQAAARLARGEPHRLPITDLTPSKSLFEMVVEEGADFPIYTAAVPIRRMTNKGAITELVPTAEFVNDCEREIIRRDQWDVGAAVTQISDPVSYPPTFPPVRPFEHSSLFWSFIYNQLLAKRLSRDELEQAYKDIALLNRMQQYDMEVVKRDKDYARAIERLAWHFSRKDNIHKATWPTTDAKCQECKCVICRRHKRYKERNRHGHGSPQSLHSEETYISSLSSGSPPPFHRDRAWKPTHRRHRSRYDKERTRGHQQSRRRHHHHSVSSVTTVSPRPSRRVHTHSHRNGDYTGLQRDSRRSQRHEHTRTNHTHRYSTSTSESTDEERQRAEREDAARKLAACWNPSIHVSPDDDPGASPPSVFSAPLYFNAGGIRHSVPGASAAISAPYELNQKLSPSR